ncbi:MAG TPA: glycyl-radical enzyme activating protein [Thermoanaerobacterales bacterium]|nr:glycyl-radical enzyme activating protein [Thermoanaerobacterales bacterium]
MIFDIQRYSIHDGPGIRTIVFLKGCPLRCPWCANPESQKMVPEIMYSEIKCVLCQRCVNACPVNAIKVINGKIHIDRELCNVCGLCWEACLNEALKVAGKEVTVKEVLSIVEKDRIFYERSGGGVTLSGGEPLMQAEFSAALLAACKKKGLNTAIETSGYQKWELFLPILENTDLVLLDIKMMNTDLHRKIIGVPNNLILDNARKIVELGKDIIVRIPIIPGYNDSIENLRNTAEFAANIGIKEVHLLPYHRLGESKYNQLGRIYNLKDVNVPSTNYIESLTQIFIKNNLKTQVGG